MIIKTIDDNLYENFAPGLSKLPSLSKDLKKLPSIPSSRAEIPDRLRSTFNPSKFDKSSGSYTRPRSHGFNEDPKLKDETLKAIINVQKIKLEELKILNDRIKKIKKI